MMMRKTLAALLLALISCLSARAQFYLPGDDPGYLRWSTIETPFYRIVYPEGADSLARSYGRLLEQFRHPIAHSIGQIPGERQRSKTPVILHTYNVYSNGSVGWAPRRYDLYTLPPAYSTAHTPWDIQLASHEPRHHAQLMFGYRGYMRPITWLTGQGWAPITWQIYMGRPFGEGDAVAAETGLWKGNRARTADFLDYYRVAFDQGDWRSWNRWRFGSYKHYAPDHYALGYLTIAGGRYLYDRPLLMKETLASSYKNPLRIAPWNMEKLISESAGKKRFKDTFREMEERYNALWREEADARGPFMPMEQLTEKESFPVFYSGLAHLDGTLYLLRKGYTRSMELVRWEDGRIWSVRPFASHTGWLYAEPVLGRLYWSETVPDKRWDLAGTSVIRYYDLASGKMRDLAKGRRLYNPQPSPDGQQVSAVEYPVNGGSLVLVLDAKDGQVLRRLPAPEGVQATESAWLGEDLYVMGISREGYGLYRVGPDGAWETELAPSIQKVQSIGTNGKRLEWVSDRDGSNQLYSYDPSRGRLEQLTSARYGATDFCRKDGYLYFVAQTLDGRHLFRTALSDLKPREVSYADVHTWQVEEALMEQEKALGKMPDLDSAVPMSAPKPYRKVTHLPQFHTWLPLYVNYDNIASGSFDLSYESLAIGATAFFQNELGTLSGSVGYGFHQDPNDDTRWRHSLHTSLTYTGQYPVIEASFDLGDQAAWQYNLVQLDYYGDKDLRNLASLRNAPQAVGTLRAYVPLTFNKGGWLRGLIPQATWSLSNNRYESIPILLSAPERFEDVPTHYVLTGFGEGSGSNYLMQSLSASIRGYAMLSRGSSQVYPRLGLGLEGGISLRPGIADVFAPNVYAYAYGYLPGLWREQGLRLSAILQHQLRTQPLMFGEMRVGSLPRGFQGTAGSAVAQQFPTQGKMTADYAIPLYFGDWSLAPITYISHFVLTPHFDFTVLPGWENLWSGGADLTVQLRHLFMVDFDTSVGVSFSWLGGSWMENTGQNKPYHIGFIFNMDI